MDIKQQAAEGGDKEAVYERFKKAKKDYKAEMKEVLDEEQYQQFAEGKWGTNDKEAIDRALE